MTVQVHDTPVKEVYTKAEVDALLASISTGSPVTGDMTIGPADDWQDIIARHDGSGSLTLEDGLYEATDKLRISSPSTVLRAENMGQATITGSWNIRPGQFLWLQGFDLKAPVGERLYWGAGAWCQFRDCFVEADDADTDILVQVYGGIFRVDSRDRISTWNCGTGIHTDVIDADSGAALKFVGNATENFIRFRSREGSSHNMIALDQSSLMCATVRFFAEGTAGTSDAKGIACRRGSSLTFQDTGNRVEGFSYGVIAQQESRAAVDNITIRDCKTRGLAVIGAGRISYGPGTVFANNASNTGTSNQWTKISN